MGRVITFGSDEYNVTTDDEGKISLMRYNKRYQMWIKLTFGDISSVNNAAEYVMDILSKQYIEEVTGRD